MERHDVRLPDAELEVMKALWSLERYPAHTGEIAARLASGSSIKIETLEQTWRTIVSGIDETKQIQENARKQRVEDQKRLEAIKAQFDQMYHMPDKGSVNH